MESNKRIAKDIVIKRLDALEKRLSDANKRLSALEGKGKKPISKKKK